MYEQIPSPNYKSGRTQKIKLIVIHHWDDPAKKPTIQGVISHFLDPSVQVAAHYVVSGDRIIQMVQEQDTAWHAQQANPYTIGIEIDPNVPGNTYQTVGRLVKEIRERNGELPLIRHSAVNNTSCPGDISLDTIENYSKGEEDMAANPTLGWLWAFYRVVFGEKAPDGWAENYMKSGKDVFQITNEVVNWALDHGVAYENFKAAIKESSSTDADLGRQVRELVKKEALK